MSPTRQLMKDCTKCGKLMAFCRSRNDKWVPVDEDTLSDKDRLQIAEGEAPTFRHGEHVSHFATCPDAAHFRRS